jgi:maltose 6'-phosphate phosphatase
VDIVCFQEVAALWNNGKGDWDTNSARIINDCLDAPYHVVADWAHLGFDKYREGVAILSRYPVVKHKSKYVSKSDDFYNIHSRKVVMAQIKVPYIGLLNVFSSHLSWWDDGFPEQFEKLRRWAGEEQIGQVRGTLLCGDFNIEAGSSGYELVIDTDEYDDQYLAANDPKVFEQIFRGKNACWRRYLEGDRRIDYIFMNKSSELRVVAGTPLFTEQDYGRVSDHCGYLMTFEPK